MKAQLRTINDHGVVYKALMFVCPGCESQGGSGLHMLTVNTNDKSPSWEWDGNLEAPTLTPSILAYKDNDEMRCHSFLRKGVFAFLGDCAHDYANQKVPIPDLPDWAVKEGTGNG